jgi:carbon monoxide dehydrogenase subunit G
MLIDGQFTVTAPPEALMRHLFDARLMASCLPGCESLEALDTDRYRAVVTVALAGVKARFDMQVRVVERADRFVRATTRGEEGGNASQVQADNRITLEEVPGGTRVSYASEVSVTGRLGRFALGMMKKKAQALGDEFAQNLQSRLTELEATAPPAAAVSPPTPAPQLPWWRVVWNWLLGRRHDTSSTQG